MTLVEVLIAATLTLLAAIPIYAFSESMVRHEADASRLTALQTDARFALDGAVRELRQAYSGDKTPAILSMSPTSLTFLSPDRSTPYRLKRVTYRVNGQVLQRAVAVSSNAGSAPWTFGPTSAYRPLVGSLKSGSGFTFHDKSGAVTTDPGAVRIVKLSVTVDATPTARAPGERTYSTSVELRSTP